jgi:hypothetical protein
MLDDAKDPTVLEHLERGVDHVLLEAALDPVVEVAKGDDDVGGPIGTEHDVARWRDVMKLHLAVDAR